MNMMLEPGMHGHTTFWVDSQVAFTFTISTKYEGDIFDAINFNGLFSFLRESNFLLIKLEELVDQGLQSADEPPADQQVGYMQSGEEGGQTHPGIYVFQGCESSEMLVVAFFQFHDNSSQQKSGSSGEHGDDSALQAMARLVNLVNSSLETLYSGGIPITSAAPHWLFGVSDHVTTGCPLLPPVPVPADRLCSSDSHLWPISLPDVPEDLRHMTGAGVTILVLDTLPLEQDISVAAATYQGNDGLRALVDTAHFVYPRLHAAVDPSDPQQPQTGKDIWGQFLRFQMPDHGLFIAGIICGLAPCADVTCVRISNDQGAGATIDLIEQLWSVQQRLLATEVSSRPDTVVNLSLVIPSDEDLKNLPVKIGDLHTIRSYLREAMGCLARCGVLFVAAAGNEGDSRLQPGRPRPDALYPAAFAYQGLETLIPVGAVNEHGQAATYSCYPGCRGVATCGGELPDMSSISQGDGITRVDTDRLDALVGVSTRQSYPALSATDTQQISPAPNTNGWAYWIGTSFATPIVTAVLARTCQMHRTSPAALAGQSPCAYVVAQAATKQITWDNLTSSSGCQPGRMIVAHPCTCREHVSGQNTHEQCQAGEGATAHGQA